MTLIVLLILWTTAAGVQGVGRWRGHGPWMRRRDDGIQQPRSPKLIRIGSTSAVTPFVPGSLALILIAKQWTQAAHSHSLRTALDILMGVGWTIFGVAIILNASIYFFGNPQSLVPPQFRR